MSIKVSIFGYYSFTKTLIATLLDMSFEVQYFSKNKISSADPLTSQYNIHFIDSILDDIVTNELTAFEPDYIFVCSLNEKVPPAICDIPTVCCINFHPSLLPNYRGPDPFFWILKSGEKMTGITAHKITQDWDAGDIIDQHQFNISDYETYASLVNKTLIELPNLIKKMQPILIKKTLHYSQQGTGYYFPNPSPSDYIVNWKQSAIDIERHIRSLPLERSVMTTLNSKPIKLLEAQITSLVSESSHHFKVSNDQLLIGAHDYYLNVTVLMFENQIYSGQRFLKLFGKYIDCHTDLNEI